MKSTTTSPEYTNKIQTRTRRIIFIVSSIILLVGFLQLLYRFSLPTDGWNVVETDNTAAQGVLIYIENWMGASSGLRPEDVLIAVGDTSMDVMHVPDDLVESWEVGNSPKYKIVRGSQLMQVEVPLTSWKFVPWLKGFTQNPANLVRLFGELFLITTALITVYLRPNIKAAQALWVLNLTMYLSSTSIDFIPWGLADLIDPVARFLYEALFTGLFNFFFPASLLHLALVFPKPKPIVLRYPWIEYSPYGVGFLLIAGIGHAWLWFLIGILGAIVILAHNTLTMRDAVSRAQLQWGMGGLLLGLGIFSLSWPASWGLITGTTAEIIRMILPLPFPIIGITLAIAIVRYRLFDIELIIRRTLVYSLLTAMLGLVYFGMVILLEGFLRSLVRSSGQVATVVSTLAVAALFTPLRRRVQQVIDRRFYRQKYNAEQVLARFALTARDEVDVDRLATALVSAADEAMRPGKVMIWLKSVAGVRRDA